MTRPLLRDVAALAGVSEPTVSRVLNGRKNVADATRHRVAAALEELGYAEVPEPKAVPRNVVGLICGEFLNPVFPTFVHHISTDLGRRGFLTKVAVTDPHLNPEERCLRELLADPVDGVVFIGGSHAEVDGDLSLYEQLAQDQVPMVLVNGRDTALDVPRVHCDEEVGAYKATTHLIGLGHTHIGCVLGSTRFIPTTRMMTGYRRALEDHMVDEPDESTIHVSFTLEGGRVGALRLLDRGATGLITGNDLMALGAARAAASLRHRPRTVSIVGYDGTDFTAVTNPPLTTLRQPFEDMATHISEALVSEIDGSRRLRDPYVFEPELVHRDSTRPPLEPTATVGP